MPPQELGISPTEEFPQVYGVLGGEAPEPVRIAAKRFVGAAGRHYETATPTADYPYPAADRVFFYLLTFDGVRRIDTDLESASEGTGEQAELYRLGQEVLTELRVASGG